MDFVDNILRHYLRESQQGFGSAVFGGILIIAAILLFKYANPLSLLKGLTIPFLLVGLIMGLGGVGDGYNARKAIPEKISLFKKDEKAFFKQEVNHVEGIHKSWRGIRIFWSIFTLAGILILLVVRKDYWTGVAIGTIMLSIAGHIEEAISKRFNERYYHEVLTASKMVGLYDQQQFPVNKSTNDTLDIGNGKMKKSYHSKEVIYNLGNTRSESLINSIEDSVKYGNMDLLSEDDSMVGSNLNVVYSEKDKVNDQNLTANTYHNRHVHFRKKPWIIRIFSKNKYYEQ